jgi:hypothetical protein
MQVLRDFKELLELLNEQRVKYVIVGGYAVAFNGAPRYTGDIDILVKPDKANAARILKALKAFGFASLKLTESDLNKPDITIQFGIAPIRIDIITSISGVTWEKAFKGRKKGKYGNVPVSYLGRKELIENKKATGRPKDLADIDALDQG